MNGRGGGGSLGGPRGEGGGEGGGGKGRGPLPFMGMLVGDVSADYRSVAL